MTKSPIFQMALLAIAIGAAAEATAQSVEPPASPPGEGAPDSFSDLARRLMPSVVNISTRQTVSTSGLNGFLEDSPLEEFNEFFGRDGDGLKRVSSLGSGFIIDELGHVVTNNHVIEEADEIDVVLSDGTILPAELVGTDPETDIAVLKVIGENLPPVELGNSDTAQVGDWVVAIGNPFGLGGTVTAGSFQHVIATSRLVIMIASFRQMPPSTRVTQVVPCLTYPAKSSV